MVTQRPALPQYLVIVSFMILGIAITTIGGNLWFSGARSKSWRLAEGSIVRIRSLGSTGRGDRFLAEYTYTFDGIDYFGDRIAYGAASGNEESLRNLHDRDNINVHVNPRNPRESVLIPGATSFAKVITMLGCFFVFVGVLVGWSALFTSTRSESVSGKGESPY
jgi:hypothetical protein